jgi:hypothetical protein
MEKAPSLEYDRMKRRWQRGYVLLMTSSARHLALTTCSLQKHTALDTETPGLHLFLGIWRLEEYLIAVLLAALATVAPIHRPTDHTSRL